MIMDNYESKFEGGLKDKGQGHLDWNEDVIIVFRALSSSKWVNLPQTKSKTLR